MATKSGERLKELSETVMHLDRCIAQMREENSDLKSRVKELEAANFSLKVKHSNDTQILNDIICALRYDLSRRSD